MNDPALRRTIVRAASAALFAALAVSVAGGLRRYIGHRRENGRLETRVAEAEASVQRKRAQVTLAQKDDALLETEARRQLGLVAEGEIEFRFVPDDRGGPEKIETASKS